MQSRSMSRRRFLTVAGGTVMGVGVAGGLVGGNRIVQAQALPGAPSFKGAAGQSIQGPVDLNAGMVVLRAQHNGTGNFAVWLFIPASGQTPQESLNSASGSDQSLVYDEISSFKGAAVAMASMPGPHYLGVTASGAFQISVEQPTPEAVQPVQQTTFSGKGKDVTPYFVLPSGISTLSVQTTAASFRGSLYHLDDLGGGPVQGGINGYGGVFFDFTAADYQTAYFVTLPDAGPYLLSADNLSPTDTWTYTFQ